MNHAYHTPGLTDLDAIRKYAREREPGEKTQIHLHPYIPGLPPHATAVFGYTPVDCSEVVEGTRVRAR